MILEKKRIFWIVIEAIESIVFGLRLMENTGKKESVFHEYWQAFAKPCLAFNLYNNERR